MAAIITICKLGCEPNEIFFDAQRPYYITDFLRHYGISLDEWRVEYTGKVSTYTLNTYDRLETLICVDGGVLICAPILARKNSCGEVSLAETVASAQPVCRECDGKGKAAHPPFWESKTCGACGGSGLAHS